jgi:hypothetical protein
VPKDFSTLQDAINAASSGSIIKSYSQKGGNGGDASGSNGANGYIGKTDNGHDKDYTGRGGSGSAGKPGAGGGILLQGINVNLSSAQIDTRGGNNDISNAGTLKVFIIAI